MYLVHVPWALMYAQHLVMMDYLPWYLPSFLAKLLQFFTMLESVAQPNRPDMSPIEQIGDVFSLWDQGACKIV